MNQSELVLIKAVLYQGTDTADKNGKMPLMFIPIAGKYPSIKQVNSGTFCERKGIEVGKVYLVRVLFRGESLVHGKDYDVEPLQEITSGLEMIKLTQELGQGEVIQIGKPEVSVEYSRKGTVIESERTRQIKAGTYIPAAQTGMRDHSNAAEILKGTSQEGEVVQETRRIEKALKAEQKEEKGGKAA